MKRVNVLAWLQLLLIVYVSVSAAAIAGKDGKGGGKGGEGSGGDDGSGGADSPAVQYRVTYLDAWGNDWETSARDMTDDGTIVGTAINSVTDESRAVMWLQGGPAIDITDLVGPAANGWIATLVRSVNALGQMVGIAEKPGFVDRAFFYDSATNNFLLLTEVPGQTTIGHVDINDYGAVACQVKFGSVPGGVVYSAPTEPPQMLPASIGGYWIRINNLGTITDQAGVVVYPPYSTNAVDNLSGSHRIWGLADNSDVISGRFLGEGNGKKGTPAGPAILDLVSNAQQLLPAASGNHGHDINNQHDFLVWESQAPDNLYKQGEGLLDLDAEIVNKDAVWQQANDIVAIAVTNPSQEIDPDATGYGAICGTIWATNSSGRRAYVLFPEDQP